MENQEPISVLEKEILPDLDNLSDIMPSMNVTLKNENNDAQVPCIVSDEELLGLYDEVVKNLREDRLEIGSLVEQFKEMVINEGDASSASKEALVNLIKIKSDTADKMSKIAELKTRIKLRDRDTFPKYLAAKQENQVYIGADISKRNLLQEVNAKFKNKSIINNKE